MSDGGSAIRKAFQAALQHELNSLYQLMAQLDALAGHPLPAGMKPSPRSFGAYPHASCQVSSTDRQLCPTFLALTSE